MCGHAPPGQPRLSMRKLWQRTGRSYYASAMHALLAFLVIANLLLRGVAVPHAHAASADVADHAVRPHVHLSGPADRHAPSHTRHQEGHGHGHSHRHVHHDIAHDHARAEHHDSTPGPEHDDDAVYVADDTVIFVSVARSLLTHVVPCWLMPPPPWFFVAPSAVAPPPRHVRPPGDDAATIHTLFPHVLRV
jgi:hypothetical protein